MTTAKDLIRKAMTVSGILAFGQPMTAAEDSTALGFLNDIITEWKSIGDGFVAPLATEVPVVSGTGDYYLGTTDPGGVQFVSTQRPEMIQHAFWRDADSDTPLTPLSVDEYDSIPNKSAPGTPGSYYYDAQVPCGILKLYPKPNTSGTVVIRSNAAPLADVGLTTVLESVFTKLEIVALKWTLAAELCPEFGIAVSALVASRASTTRTKAEEIIFARNMKTLNLTGRPSTTGGFYSQ